MHINQASQASGRFPFGIDPTKVADELRKLAASIDAGEVCIQAVRLLGVASGEEYTLQVLRITFVEKNPT